jgi:tetratricopeptide (TPR) repeat protein
VAVTQRTALAAATRLGDRAGEAHALCGLGRAHALVGSADESRACLSRALLLFRDLGDDATSAQVHVHMAGALAQQGRYRDAISHAEQARDLFAAAGHRNGQAGAVNNIGWYRLLMGDHDQAVAGARAAVHAFRELGDRHGEAIALDSLGTAYHHLGQHAQALACCQRALAVVRELGDRSAQAGILFNVGDAQHAAGDDDAARAAWTEALTTLDEQNPVQVGRLRARLSTLRR